MRDVAIVGFGFVGQAVYGSIKDTSNVLIIDPVKGYPYSDALKEYKFIICCLPTPESNDRSQDCSAYKEFLENYNIHESSILVVKSTVTHKTYEYIKSYVHEKQIVLNPEFLNQLTSYSDFKNQSHVILGGNIDSCQKVRSMYQMHFWLSPKVEYCFCTPEIAINTKYIHNIYHAYKCLFWNYVNQTCGDQRGIFRLYSKITGNTKEMQYVCADGKPGYGGACFPKDVKAFNSENEHVLTKFMIEYNDLLRGE